MIMTNKIKRTIGTIKGNQLFHIGHITDINKEPYITQADLLELTAEVERLTNALRHVFSVGHNLECIFCGFKDKYATEALADSTDGIELKKLKKWRPSSFGETAYEDESETSTDGGGE